MPPLFGAATHVPDMDKPMAAAADQLREDLQKMTAAALEAQKKGDLEGSKFKTILAEEIREKLKELEEREMRAALATVSSVAAAVQSGELPTFSPEIARTATGTVTVLPPAMKAAALPPTAMQSLTNSPGLGCGPVPGLPPPPLTGGLHALQEWQRMVTLYQNPELAMNFTQQQALEYEQEKSKSTKVEPEVVELAHHFNLTDRHARLLDEQLKKRNNTYEDDIAAMYEILKGAKNPADLLMVSVRWMSEGVFRGTQTPNPDVEKVAKKYRLDAPSACKLAEVLESRSDPDGDLRKVCTHLERSNRPSALVMMMLKDLKSGNAVEESTKTPAIGSYLHIQETKRATQRRSRSRGGGRSRSRPRGGRSRSRRRRSRSGSARRNRSKSHGRRGRE
mmetsp:Transcript_103121/g.204813  ORF Transcript_103121/g.204813 Transcript_103121/m.204813 type:complete len:393 (+) Transcript_103121:92-1270(+)